MSKFKLFTSFVIIYIASTIIYFTFFFTPKKNFLYSSHRFNNDTIIKERFNEKEKNTQTTTTNRNNSKNTEHYDSILNTKPTTKDLTIPNVANLINKNKKPGALTIIGYKSYKYANSVAKKDITKTLINHGIKKRLAEKSAKRIVQSLKGKVFRRVTVFITAGSTIYTVQESISPKLNLWEKLSIATGGGLILLNLYIFGQRKNHIE